MKEEGYLLVGLLARFEGQELPAARADRHGVASLRDITRSSALNTREKKSRKVGRCGAPRPPDTGAPNVARVRTTRRNVCYGAFAVVLRYGATDVLAGRIGAAESKTPQQAKKHRSLLKCSRQNSLRHPVHSNGKKSSW